MPDIGRKTSMMNRRLFTSLAAALLPLTVSAQSRDFPNRPIRLVLPYAPGGPTDAIARAVARRLEATLGATVIVENKPGAQGIIAAQALLQASPDGYTVGWTPSPVLTTNRIVLPKLPYKVDDFKLVTPLYRGGMVIAVSAASKATSLRQYLDEVKASGQPMIYGTAGPGGNSHLTVELLAQMAGLKTQMVPYKGDGPMALDMLAGNLPAMIATVAATEPHYRKGALKLLAFTGEERMKGLPLVPTLTESGFAIESYFWAGATLPAGTPEPIASKLQAAFESAMHSPEVKAVMTSDLVPYTRGEKEFHQMVESEFQRWSQVARTREIQFR
jgi:tripartite-type tricarboxylate transporter receptor subunit TctC